MKSLSILVVSAAAVMSLSACSNPTDEGEEQQQGSVDIVDSVQTDDEIAVTVPDDIKSSGRFTVSINPDVEPVKFLDSDGEISGLNPDLLRAAAKVMGVEAEFQQGTFDSMVPGLKAKRYDVIASVGDYIERQKNIDFIDYLKTGDGILASTSLETDVSSPEDLCGLSVGYTRGTSQQEDVESAAKACEAAGEHPVKVNAYQDAAGGILSVQSDQADAYWGDLPQMLYNVDQNPDLFEVNYTEQDSVYGIGIHKDDVEFRDALRAALLKLAEDGVYDALLTQWAQEGYGMPDFPINADISCEC